MPTFHQAVVLFPLAVALHVYEEWPDFPRWVRRYASPAYTDREYAYTHVAAVAAAIVATLLIRVFPTHWMLFVFFGLVFGPGILCNALFHLGATIRYRRYCPGVITGTVLYLPLAIALFTFSIRDVAVGPRTLIASLAVAAAFHTLEVGHNVFKRW